MIIVNNFHPTTPQFNEIKRPSLKLFLDTGSTNSIVNPSDEICADKIFQCTTHIKTGIGEETV